MQSQAVRRALIPVSQFVFILAGMQALEEGSNAWCQYGVAQMQGWRMSMVRPYSLFSKPFNPKPQGPVHMGVISTDVQSVCHIYPRRSPRAALCPAWRLL